MLKKRLLSALLYPIFLVIYLAYSLGYRIALLAQYLFTVVYIQQICGFKRSEKIISAINSFCKVPQTLTIVYSIDRYLIEENEASLTNQQIQTRILQHWEILSEINAVKKITILIESQSQNLEKVINRIKVKLSKIPTLKETKLLTQSQAAEQSLEKLQLHHKSYTPFVIVFGNYETVCQVPAKYLVNAEIAFNPGLFGSIKYDVYKSFAQYATSKQRNGK